jgi:transposase
MAHLHKKMKKGRPYYYIREMARVDGKPKVVNQVYLGSIEKILEMATGHGKVSLERIQVQEFGALWLANVMEREVGIVEMIDSVVPRGKNETGPTVGEYFLYAAYNRMIDSCSKRALPEWYQSTAVQQIRPVDVHALDSDGYWKKWDRVGEEEIRTIAEKLFARVAEIEPSRSGCFLFDTTNYYTFMASDTESELTKRGKNKEGRDWLRQVGLALLMARDTKLPLYYTEYEGNCHDSKLFGRIMDQVLGAMKGQGREEVTVVFDKGMNSEENITAIDAMEQAHFVTTYSTYYADELIHIDRSRFTPVDTPRNRESKKENREDDMLTAWRTTGEYWGQERTVIVTYNPLTATKQRYGFERKLLKLQTMLFEMKSKVRSQAPQWRKKEQILQRYHDACSELHLPKDLYDLSFENEGKRLVMGFRKNFYRIGRHIDRFGKNIIITDHHDWSTDQIVQASLDRHIVEDAFRQSKHDDLVSLFPIRHWTDSKIRCHILSCIVALCYLRLIELRLQRAGLEMTAVKAMEQMHKLHSCLCWNVGKRKPVRMLEEPSPPQGEILKAFGFEIAGGVLQKIGK